MIGRTQTYLHNGGPWDAKNQVMYSFGIIKKISSYLFAYRIIILEKGKLRIR